MRTREEIYQIACNSRQSVTNSDAAFLAMSLYAREVAVAYDEWKLKEGYENAGLGWLKPGHSIRIDSSRLYDKFLEQHSKGEGV
jgi:hypothetical protein